MADSIEKKIFQNIQAALDTLKPATLKTVKFGTFEPANEVLPCAGFFPGDDNSDIMPGVLRRGMDVIVRIVAGESSSEQAGYELLNVKPVVEAKMVEDVHRGGNAQNTQYAGSRWLYNDKDYPSAGVDITYRVEFKTQIKDPTALP